MVDLTVEEMRRELRCVPTTGEFWWLIPRRGRQLDRQAGSLVTTRSGEVYRVIGINYRKYYAHVLMWAWVTGEWPDFEIDHINDDGTDNRLSNLQPATHSENNMKKPPKRPGLTGASFYKRTGRWQAYIKKDGKHISLGYFDTAEEAHEEYKKAAARLHGEFRHSSLKRQDQ